MRKALIIQPCIPTYRRKFFELIASKADIRIISSAISIDGVQSDTADLACEVDVVQAVQFGNWAVWQRGVVRQVWSARDQVLIVNGNPRYISTVVTIIVAKLRGIKVIWWGHAMSSTSTSNRARVRFILMRLADRILTYYPEEIVRLPTVLRSRAIGVGNSVDTSKMLEISKLISTRDVESHKVVNGIGDEILLLTIGRLTKKARVDILFEAVSQLEQKGIPTVLAVLGDGECREELEQLESSLGISKSVLWVGPIFDEGKIAAWMTAADIFVYGGAVGLSLIHAFAYGLPAVISDELQSHNPEALLFEDGAHGAVFCSGNASSLAAVVEREIFDKSMLAAKGAAAQNLVRSRLGVERMADNFVRVLNDLDTDG